MFRKVINQIAKAYGHKPGKMLVHTGVIGWVLSSLAQISAIVFNDKIPKEQKMFLIPQEMADAGINIISFYLITQGFKNVANKLVKTGRWLPKSVKDFLVYKGAADKLGKGSFDVYRSNLLTPSGLKRYNSFKNGIDVIGTTIGSVISCNLVTPVARNEIASDSQKKGIARMNKTNQKPDLKINNKYYAYFKRPTMQNFYSGNMKV
ncbi:hypothetical protein IJ541_11290 [bacterium]|nr:hypothetical protein [bacterium]